MCSSLGDLECSNSTQKMENHLLFDFDLGKLDLEWSSGFKCLCFSPLMKFNKDYQENCSRWRLKRRWRVQAGSIYKYTYIYIYICGQDVQNHRRAGSASSIINHHITVVLSKKKAQNIFHHVDPKKRILNSWCYDHYIILDQPTNKTSTLWFFLT